MKYLWLAFLLLLPGMASAQSRETVPPTCTVAQLSAGECAPALEGVRVHITNGNAAVDTDCATTTGAVDLICEYDGSNWVTAPVYQAAQIDAADLAAESVGVSELDVEPISFFFCGNGPNAGTAWYWSPVSNHPPDGGVWTIGGTLCDGNDGSVVGDEDAPIPGALTTFALTVNNILCTQLDATDDDIIVYTLMDDTVATTLTCSITMGSGTTTIGCNGTLSSGIVVAAGSALAMRSVAVDDDKSAEEGFCLVSGYID